MTHINRVQTITEAQAAEIYHRLPHRSRLLFALGLDTGLRVSDMLRLKFHDIEQPMRVYVSRIDEVLPFPITDWLLDELISLPRISGDNYIFGSSRKRRRHIHRTTYHRDIKRAAQGLDFTCSAHSTRKLYLTY